MRHGLHRTWSERRPWREICFPNGEWVLAVALTVEIAIFAGIGENFFTWANFFEVVRLSVELGLLALALTPIMITGGTGFLGSYLARYLVQEHGHGGAAAAQSHLARQHPHSGGIRLQADDATGCRAAGLYP